MVDWFLDRPGELPGDGARHLVEPGDARVADYLLGDVIDVGPHLPGDGVGGGGGGSLRKAETDKKKVEWKGGEKTHLRA